MPDKEWRRPDARVGRLDEVGYTFGSPCHRPFLCLSPMSISAYGFPSGGSPVAERMRNLNWTQSPLGSPDNWPQSLRAVVSLMLSSKFPMFVAWGPALAFLYNDAYADILGDKHPKALGQRFEDIWSEIWEDVGPIADRAMAGMASFYENLPLTMRRKGYDERTWFTFSYSPVYDESGSAAGMYCVCTETTQQVLAERQRVEDNERLYQLFQQAPGIMTVLRGPDHVFELANDAYLQLVGNRNLLGKTAREALPEVEGQGFFELLDRVYTSGNHVVVRETPIQLRRRIGGPMEARYLSFVYQPIRDKEGQVTGIFVEGSDVTEAVLTNRALRESEARLHLALTAGRMGAWQWDIKNERGYWLKGMASVHGFPEDTPSPSFAEYLDLVHPQDRGGLQVTLQKAMTERRDYSTEYRIIWPDGRVRWIEAHGNLAFDEDGMPSYLGGLCIDITERKKTEQNLAFLAKASAELATLVDYEETLSKVARLAVPGFADWCAIDLLDGDQLRRVAVAHVDPEKVELARELFQRFPPDPNAPTGTWQVIRSGKAELVPEITDDMIENTVADPDYRAIMLSLGLKSYIGAPLSTHGKTIGVLTCISAESNRLYTAEDMALVEDLAKRAAIAMENMELYDALKQSDRSKDIFLATLSHELRNPLASMTTGLDLIRLSRYDRKVTEKSVGVIDRQVRQLIRLVDDLMDISRIATGKITLKPEATTLHAVLNSAMETSRPAIDAAKHRLTFSLPDESTDIVGDPVRLTQVFSNLLNNAAKYTDAGGEISVRVRAERDEWVVEVSDTGVGISADMLGHIFDMFMQEHPLTRAKGGLGVGLGLADSLVKMHGGSISARSDGKGKGSTFIVCLPRRSTGNTAPASSSVMSAGDNAAGFDILVVDDNIDAAQVTAELLVMMGHKPRTAHDGGSAIREVAAQAPEVIFLDIGLPDMDGYDVAKRIRALPVISQPMLVAVTGWGQEKDKLAAKQAGFDHHLTKPVNIDRLKDMLDQAGARSRR